jgi:hypothetical protein
MDADFVYDHLRSLSDAHLTRLVEALEQALAQGDFYSAVDAIKAQQTPGDDLIRVVLTNLTTNREITTWLRVPPPSGPDEAHERHSEIQLSRVGDTPDSLTIHLENHPGVNGRVDELLGPLMCASLDPRALREGRTRPAYTPEDFLSAIVCNRIRWPRADQAKHTNPEYQSYKKTLGKALLIEKLSPPELAALQQSLCDRYVRGKFGRKNSQNHAEWDKARAAFNLAMRRYLNSLGDS